MAEPPITLRAIHSEPGSNLTPTRIVIHATCPDIGYPDASAAGTAHGTAVYFQSPNAGGSAHYVADPDHEEHCVPDAVIAWHAPPNERSIGIEICAEGGDYPRNYTREQWLSPEVWPAVARAAARARELAERFGIPKVKLSPADLLAGKRGVCGHVDVSQAWHQSTHSDPGVNFPWDQFMPLLTQEPDVQLTDQIPDFDAQARTKNPAATISVGAALANALQQAAHAKTAAEQALAIAQQNEATLAKIAAKLGA